MNLKTAIATLATLALGACASANPVVDRPAPLTGGLYVAMGSSIASGPGLGALKPDAPVRCSQTFANYPTLLAEKLRMTLVDVSCGGATTEHILGPWQELAPQLQAVTADTRLVTISIGGNDLNYVGRLIMAGCGPDGQLTIPGRGTFTCPPLSPPSEDGFARVEENLRAIAKQVRERAPKARLVFVQYPQLVPQTLCDNVRISAQDASDARILADRLAAITASVAAESGALLVPIHAESANHTPCDAQPWTHGNPKEIAEGDGMIWHANRAGMLAVADRIADWLAR